MGTKRYGNRSDIFSAYGLPSPKRSPSGRRHACLLLIGVLVLVACVGPSMVRVVATSLEAHGMDAAAMGTEDAAHTIFVSLASYRDIHCPETLLSIFEQAVEPRRVTVGVVDQRKAGEVPCVRAASVSPLVRPRFIRWLDSNVRVTTSKAEDAMGPAVARYWAAQLRRKERYYLQIDSHTTFVARWDTIVIAQLLRLENERWPKVILSYHPPPDEDLAAERKRSVARQMRRQDETRAWLVQALWPPPPDADPAKKPWGLRALCDAEFHPDLGVPVIFTRETRSVLERDCRTTDPAAAPGVLQPFTAAGFVFARAALIDDVPFAPDLRYVFHGEEIFFTARAFAKGWRSYRPCETVASHIEGRATEPHLWTDLAESEMAAKREAAYGHLLSALQLPLRPGGKTPAEQAHGSDASLLSSADVAKFWAFAHVNLQTWHVNASAWGC